MTEIQDVVVIGGGPAGFAAAMRAAQLGGRVTLVEQAHYGGNCMNRACIPATVLSTAVRLLGFVRKAERFGIQVSAPTLDIVALHERQDLIVEALRLGTEELLTDHGVRLVEGRGRLAAADAVEVAGQRIGARNVIIATGSVAAQPPIAGADLPGVIGSEEAIALRTVPRRIAILNHQPWGLAAAQYFHALGSAVTLLESSSQVIPDADHEIAQRFGKLLHDAGVAIERGVSVEGIGQADDGALTVLLADGRGELMVDQVLAPRRLPNSTGLGLRELGVRTEQGAVRVNERMETNVPHIYAVGDVTGEPRWASKANAEGIVAAENAMGLNSRMDIATLPRCLHTWPEVAWVGLTEEQAEAQGLEINVGKAPIAINPYAMILDESAGMIKVIASRKYGKILGVHIMAPGAADLINAITVAMLAEATVGELMRFIPAHPSIGEALVDAAMDVEKRSLHLPRW